MVGGRDRHGVLSSVELYDPETNQFIPGPELPEPISYATLIEYRYGVLLIGGQNKTYTKGTIYRYCATVHRVVNCIKMSLIVISLNLRLI